MTDPPEGRTYSSLKVFTRSSRLNKLYPLNFQRPFYCLKHNRVEKHEGPKSCIETCFLATSKHFANYSFKGRVDDNSFWNKYSLIFLFLKKCRKNLFKKHYHDCELIILKCFWCPKWLFCSSLCDSSDKWFQLLMRSVSQ